MLLQLCTMTKSMQSLAKAIISCMLHDHCQLRQPAGKNSLYPLFGYEDNGDDDDGGDDEMVKVDNT